MHAEIIKSLTASGSRLIANARRHYGVRIIANMFFLHTQIKSTHDPEIDDDVMIIIQ